MFQNYYELKITGKDVKKFIKKLYRSNVYFENIEMYDKYAYVKVTEKDYLKVIKIKTIYKIEIIKLYGFLKVINYYKKYYIFFISLLLGYILLIFLSNVTFKVEVLHSKKEIRDLIYKELKYYGIDEFNLAVSYNKKEKIKNKILEDNKEKIEWLEINRVGTRYEVRVEERIINNINKDKTPAHIVAKKDGIIISIQANKGEITKKINDYVKKGDIIISGNIYKDEEIKKKVKAEGTVYAETWYKVNVDMPYHYKEIKYTNKSKKTFKLRILNKEYYLFNFNKYKTKQDKTILNIKNNLLPIEVTFSNTYETIVIDELYTKEEAMIKATKLGKDKLLKNLNKDDYIISSKILNTKENNNFLKVEIFYKVCEEISKEVKIKNNKTS